MKRILLILAFLLLFGWLLPDVQRIVLKAFTWAIATIWHMSIWLLLVIVVAFILIRWLAKKR